MLVTVQFTLVESPQKIDGLVSEAIEQGFTDCGYLVRDIFVLDTSE